MARGKKGIDGVDKVTNLFPASSAKMIERLLVRAADREARQAGRKVKAAMRGAANTSRATNRIATRLAGELAKALRHRGDVGGNRASVRQRAPDSGGRPFHFAHTVVTKSDAPAPAAGASTGGKSKTGRAAAHMRYIEREVAVERLYGSGLDAAGRGQGLEARGRDDGSWDRELGRASPDLGLTAAAPDRTNAAPGQAYIENPVKLESGERVLFSFGTIGDTFEERVAFWEALEAAEAHPSARVQHRLIVELPHEASAEARFEMMRTFCARFDADGIAYWAALHAPGEKNDARNFHAHIVYSERPAARVVDPATGQEAWDFAIVKHWTDSSRHARESRPYRQDKLRAFNNRRFIPELRAGFAGIVTTVLDRDGVKDAAGAPVRYDPRSYKDMGVDAVPMKAIDRIVADKMKDGKATILDGDYTRRLITAELRDAAAKRDKKVMDLIALDTALRASSTTKRPQDRNRNLPREMRISPWALVTGAMIRAAARPLMEAKHRALQIDVMERAATASLEMIIAATSPKAVDAARRAKDPAKAAEAPSSDGAKLLHQAAVDDLAETRRASSQARQTARYRIGAALDAWRVMAGSDLVTASTSRSRVFESEEPRRPPAAPSRDSTAVQGRESRQPAANRPAVAPAATAGQARTASTRPEPRAAVDQPGRKITRAETPPTPPGTGPNPARRIIMVTPEKAAEYRLLPTTADLAAASATVSKWIKVIADSDPTVEGRMARLDAFVTFLKDDLRRRKAAFRDAQRPPITTGPGEDLGRANRQPTAAAGAVATQPSAVPAEPKLKAATPPSAVPATPKLEATEPRLGLAEPNRTAEPVEAKVNTRAVGSTVGNPVVPLNEAPIDKAADIPREEHPDDRKRRLRLEEEKRKKKRKAVLGRKNRGRER